MDQFASSNTMLARRLQQARLAKGYSLEDLAIATGLTIDEIAAAEEPGNKVPQHYVDRIDHALG